MVIALIALAAFVVLLSVQVCYAHVKYEALKEWTTSELAKVIIRLKKLESEVKENEQH